MIGFDQQWPLPAVDLILADDEVHIWRASLSVPDARAGELARMLANDEKERAARFHFERDRRRFIAGRSALRTILGHYMQTDPASLQFHYGPQGKPSLANQSSRVHLNFNLAHSHELALLTFTRGREIGVDLEYVRPLHYLDQVAARFFSAHEYAELEKLPVSQRQTAFFNCWTRKEAYIKAIGEGLSMPLGDFDVSLTPGEAAALIDVQNQPLEAGRWAMHALQPAANYIAALAVEGHDWRLSCYQWPG
jgi:4'-phosphopantetheinyl transferase